MNTQQRSRPEETVRTRPSIPPPDEAQSTSLLTGFSALRVSRALMLLICSHHCVYRHRPYRGTILRNGHTLGRF